MKQLFYIKANLFFHITEPLCKKDKNYYVKALTEIFSIELDLILGVCVEVVFPDFPEILQIQT